MSANDAELVLDTDVVFRLSAGVAGPGTLGVLYFRRPAALDVGQHRPDVGVVEHLGVHRHGALEVGAGHGGGAPLGHVEQHLVGMVPSVAGCVVRRRRQGAVGVHPPPVGLSFEVGAVAGRAALLVDHGAARHQLRVGGVRAVRRAVLAGQQPYHRKYRRCGQSGHDHDGKHAAVASDHLQVLLVPSRVYVACRRCSRYRRVSARRRWTPSLGYDIL